MIELNWLIILATGLVPLAVGSLWYGPLFGKTWMVEAGMTMDKMEGANMVKIFGLTLVFGMMIAVALTPVVIHQMGIFSVLQNAGVDKEGTEAFNLAKDFMTKYGAEFRSFKHGALHGFITTLFLLLPVMGTNALFERKSWKYILLNVGYWGVSAAIMGGIICAWA